MVRWKRMPIKPAAGGGVHFPLALKSIRLAIYGCANRPFYHIVVNMNKRHQHDQPIEQLGTFDPLPNKYNEVLVSINVERLRYWLSHRTVLSKPVASLLGLSGLLPIHPSSYKVAWKNRYRMLKFEANKSKENEIPFLEEDKFIDSEENKVKDSNESTEASS